MSIHHGPVSRKPVPPPGAGTPILPRSRTTPTPRLDYWRARVAAENAAAAKKAAEPPRRRTRYDKPVAEIVNEAKQTLFDHRLQKAKWAAEEARNPYTSRNPYSRRP